MSTNGGFRARHAACAARGAGIAAPALALCGCSAMGELARTAPWAWIAGVVVVLAVVGWLASRMRR